MAKAYSYDLRSKIMKLVDEGAKMTHVAAMFGISRKAIMDWRKLRAETGDFKEKSGYHTGHRQIIRDHEGFRRFIEENNDKSAKELARMWPQKISAASIIRMMKKIGYSYKKNVLSSKKKC